MAKNQSKLCEYLSNLYKFIMEGIIKLISLSLSGKADEEVAKAATTEAEAEDKAEAEASISTEESGATKEAANEES